jgi:hypothetical protein
LVGAEALQSKSKVNPEKFTIFLRLHGEKAVFAEQLIERLGVSRVDLGRLAMDALQKQVERERLPA